MEYSLLHICTYAMINHMQTLYDEIVFSELTQLGDLSFDEQGPINFQCAIWERLWWINSDSLTRMALSTPCAGDMERRSRRRQGQAITMFLSKGFTFQICGFREDIGSTVEVSIGKINQSTN